MRKLITLLMGGLLTTFTFGSDFQCDPNREFVVNELAQKYPLGTAIEAEEAMNKIMAKRGLTSLDMLAVMWIECRLVHTEVNPITQAFGIIQFMPMTCPVVGISYAQLIHTSLLTQIRLAEIYFRYAESIAKNPITVTEDLYCAVLAPAKIGKDTLYAYNTRAYQLNKCLNMVYGDGGLSNLDIQAYIYNVIPFRSKLRFLNWTRTDYSAWSMSDIHLDCDPRKYRPTYNMTEFKYYPVTDNSVIGTSFAHQ